MNIIRRWNHDQRHDQPQHDNITLHAASALRLRFICYARAVVGGTVVAEGTHVPPSTQLFVVLQAYI